MQVNSRTIALLAAMTAGAAWLFAEPAPRNVSARGPATVEAGVGSHPLDGQIRDETERLRRRLDAAPRLAGARRDPFAFAVPVSAASPSTPKAERPPQNLWSPVQQDPEPQLDLLGVGEDLREGHRVRTAIVGGPNRELWILQEGEMLGLRYRVARIGTEAAELVDVSTGAPRRLFLR